MHYDSSSMSRFLGTGMTSTSKLPFEADPLFLLRGLYLIWKPKEALAT